MQTHLFNALAIIIFQLEEHNIAPIDSCRVFVCQGGCGNGCLAIRTINVQALAQRGQVEAITLTSQQGSIPIVTVAMLLGSAQHAINGQGTQQIVLKPCHNERQRTEPVYRGHIGFIYKGSLSRVRIGNECCCFLFFFWYFSCGTFTR